MSSVLLWGGGAKSRNAKPAAGKVRALYSIYVAYYLCRCGGAKSGVVVEVLRGGVQSQQLFVNQYWSG